MRIHLTTRRRRRWSASLLLVALLFRAYVPVGFMPATGSPFLLALCPEGRSVSLPAHHDHHGSSPAHDHFEHCPFGSAPAGGPSSTLLAISPPAPLSSGVRPLEPAPAPPVRLSPAHAPRGPPAFI